MKNKKFKVGDRVYFGRKNGEKSLGMIVKINRKYMKVKLLEKRGTRRHSVIGELWNVPPVLCEAA